MWASDRGNIHIVDLLLNKGANPNITSKVCLEGAVNFNRGCSNPRIYVVYGMVFIDDCKS